MKLPIISRSSRGKRGSAQNRLGRRKKTLLSRVGSLVVWLPLLAFFVACCFKLYSVYTLIQNDLTPIVAAEASTQLHREVRLKKLDLVPLGTVTLEDLRISDGPSFANETPAIVRADKVAIHYSLYSLLFDTPNVSHSLGLVTLDNPILRITRFPENQYNFSDLLVKKNNVVRKPFLGTIQVNNGTVIFKDHLAPASHIGVPAVNELADINGSVDFSSPRHVLFNATGRDAGNVRFTTASVHGGASRLHASTYAMFLHVDNGALAYWSTYFKDFPQFHVTGGIGTADVQLVKTGPKSPLDLSGNVAFVDGSMRMADSKVVSAPIMGMSGTARFNMASIITRGTFYLDGQRIAAGGVLYDYQAPGPYIDFTAAATNANVHSLIQAIPPIKLPPGVTSAAASGVVSFVGPLKSPTIDGNLTSPRVTFMAHDATNVKAHIHFYNRVFSVAKATFQFPHGGSGSANLIVDSSFSTPQVRAGGKIRGYDLSDLLQAGLVADTAQLKGRGDFDFVADTRTGPLILRSNVSSSGFSVRGMGGLQGAGRITWPNGREIQVDRFVARGPQGTIAAAGYVPVQTKGQGWDLALDASGVDLNMATRPFVTASVQGLGSFHGILTGPSGAPDVAGRIEVFGGRYGRYSADSITGNVNFSGDSLAMSKVMVRRYPTEATIAGTVTGLKTSNPTVNANIHFARADVEDFSNLVQQFNAPSPTKRVKLSRHVQKQVQVALSTLTGTAQGDVHIAGHIDDPQVVGVATVTDATVGAYRVDRARANFDYEKSRLQVTRGLVSIEGADVTASGYYFVKTGQLSGTFAGSDIDLSRFRRITRPYANVNGTVNFSGSLAGTIKQPAVAFGIVTHDVTLNRQQVADFSAFARYDDGLVSLTGDPWVIDVARPATYNSPAGHTIYRVDTFKLELPTATYPKRPIYLAVDADIPRDAPETVKHFIDTVRASSLADTPAATSIIDYYNRVPQPFSGQLSADAIKVYGNLDALDVSTVAHVTNLTVGQNVAQSVDVTVNSVVEHNGAQAGLRSSDGTLAAQKISLAGLPLDGLNASASMTGRNITLSNFRATSDQAYVEAQGTANLDGDIQGSVDASGIPLSLFNVYLPKTRALTGELSSLTVTASGPTKQPDLTASISLDKPAITVRAPEAPAAIAPQAPVVVATATSGKKTKKARKAPVVAAAQNIPDATTQTYSLDRIRSGSITLKTVGDDGDRILSITNLSAFKGGHPVAVLSGSIPLKWNNGAALALDQTDPQLVSAQLTIQDLGVIAALSPTVDPTKTGGSLVATLSPASTASGNRIVGRVELTDGSLGFVGVNTSLRKIAGSATFSASEFAIDKFTAESSDTGALNLSGGGKLGDHPNLNLTLTAEKFAVNEAGNATLLAKYYSSSFKGIVNGSLRITGAPLEPHISALPVAPVVISQVAGTIPSPTAAAAAAPVTYPIDPYFDINVTVGDQNIPAKISNALINASAGGTVTVGGRLSAPTLEAKFTIYKGNVIIPPSTNMKFVRPYGVFNVSYPVDVQDESGNIQPGMQQYVDLNAEATVSVRRSTLAAYQSVGQGTTTSIGSGIGGFSTPIAQPTSALADTPVRYTIDAHIHGYLNDPRPKSLNIDLSSNPNDLNDPQMLAALGGYSGLLGPNGIQDQVNSLVASVLLPGILRPLESSVATAFGLSDFSFDYSNNTSPSVTLTKALTKRIDITYIQSFGARDTQLINSTNVLPLYTVKLSYSLSNRLQLSYSTDDQHNNIVALEGVYGF